MEHLGLDAQELGVDTILQIAESHQHSDWGAAEEDTA
jgi:hypothetical protein